LSESSVTFQYNIFDYKFERQMFVHVSREQAHLVSKKNICSGCGFIKVS